MHLYDVRKSPLAAIAVMSFVATCLLLSSAALAQGVGWRTDGTGKYLDAKPITEWSTEKNVVWSTPMPAQSNATPVIVGDRLFVCAEPTTLICVSLADGEILWQRSNNFEEMADEAQLAEMAAANEKANQQRRERGKLYGEMRKLKQALQDKPEDEDAKKKMADAEAKMKQLNDDLNAYANLWYSMPEVHDVNGFTSATPVSDGQNVYVSFGTGLVAAYDLDGNKLWARMVEKPNIMWGPCASPIIVDGKLIVHIHKVFALDPATGEEIWATPAQWSWGTPSVTTIGDTTIIITGAGDVLRADDGENLSKPIAKLTYCATVIEGDVVYFIENGGKALKLPAAIEDGNAKFETLWETKPNKERYYASPVIHDGLVYTVQQMGVFSVIDAANGEVVYEQKLDFGKSTCYPSLAMAGDLIYVSSDNGVTYIVKPGREYQEVARNELEPFRSSPVFVGDKLYIRAHKNLYCLSETGE